MFLAVPINQNDIKDVFYLQLHLAIDSDIINSFHISEQELAEDFRKKLFECFIICNSNALYQRPLACLLFSEDYSFQYGRGLYIDSFYVIEGLRDQGLGRQLMGRLCQEIRERNYNYIKLYFLSRDSLKLVYNKMGFCNETIADKKLQLLELYGKNNVEKFLSKKFLPAKCTLNNEIVRSPIVLTKDSSNVIMVNVFQSITNKMAGFVEEIVYCGWLGPVLVFKDFVGSTEILNINLFQDQLKDRQENGAQCLSLWWEVPICHDVLIKTIESAEINNVSETDGWQIGCLYREGSKDFSYFSKKYPFKGSVKCGTLNRLDVFHQNLYFC